MARKRRVLVHESCFGYRPPSRSNRSGPPRRVRRLRRHSVRPTGPVGAMEPRGSRREDHGVQDPSTRRRAVADSPGPDGALWFTELTGNIGRITTSGVMTHYKIPSNSRPIGITAGPDGAVWFTTTNPAIGRVTKDGQTFTLYSQPRSQLFMSSITAGPDGALWFSNPAGTGRITTAGQVKLFPKAQSDGGITTGPDNALWFANGKNIGRLTTSGMATSYPIPGANMQYVAAGPDHRVWFTRHFTCHVDAVGDITTSGTSKRYRTVPCSEPSAIALGPDGAMWFTELAYDHIDRIALDGRITRYQVPTEASAPFGITAGPDGAMWFTERHGNKIGRIQAI
jgi:virginiamycin B lyase